MKKTLALAVTIAATSAVDAKDLSALASAEYQACFKETATARRDCSSGCGNILASCYERQISVFENDSARLSEVLGGGPCAASATKVDEGFRALEERLLKIPQFDGLWSGFDLRVELAATKNKSLVILTSECLQTRTTPK